MSEYDLTYGREVVAVINTARGLTAAQIDTLADARLGNLNKARDAAWNAARVACRTTRYLEWGEVRDQAHAAVLGSCLPAVLSRGAVRDTARAALARDLITPAHYRTLTASWFAVFPDWQETFLERGVS